MSRYPSVLPVPMSNERFRPQPVEPPPSSFTFPPPETVEPHGKVVVGGDLEPGTLLSAYRSGLFPMRQGTGELAWWAPDPRAIFTLEGFHISHSLRRSLRRFEIRIDTAFEAVIDGCGTRGPEEYLWITPEVREAFVRLHQLRWAHSVEAWTLEGGDRRPVELAGGLYGVAIGGLFGGESMFSRRPDASKAALAALVELLRGGRPDADARLIDVQWMTPHLASLGAIEVSRREYLARLERALTLPLPPAFSPQ